MIEPRHCEICYNASRQTSTFYVLRERTPGPEVIKLFSSSTQLSMKFQLLMNDKIVKQIVKNSGSKLKKLVIYPANKC